VSRSNGFIRRTIEERNAKNEHTNNDIGKNEPAFWHEVVARAEWLVARKVEANGRYHQLGCACTVNHPAAAWQL
jgi:hypothetical protein